MLAKILQALGLGILAGSGFTHVLAQASTTTESTITPVPAAASVTLTGSVTHTVQVGPKASPHAYVPQSLTAQPGDVVVFEFYPTNHSVVKADFGAPCVPATDGVFFSGIFDSFSLRDGQIVGPPPTWSLVINDTQPLFYYCTAISSCLGNGMVGVINPNSTQTFEAQYDKALKYPYMLVPGQSMPAEGSGSLSTSSTQNPSSDTATSAANKGLSGGAIAGIVVAAVVFVAILVILFFVLGRNRVYSQWMSSPDGRTERTARWAMGSNYGGQKSEAESVSTKAPGTEVNSVVCGDHPMRHFSPGPESKVTAGHATTWHHYYPPSYSSEGQPASFGARGPSELEGAGVAHQLPERRFR
ncbi:hypothetical protein N7539_004836 [Penicillium diatomitis]|uniref:Extracellular serine-rich protein n=1 Tax=Penicillium diatomitis TaxID=2819901 RepID=A0A9W9X5K6_9EURO|nr:uncharacterized protein N7539_004836 [Penicillium diatomitis]KAJ5484848.1 hypothetical protein N7539_004836 [Penicillium diatomitis]